MINKIILNTNIEKTKSVRNSNFAYTTGLTNEQKKFLRENGAINVPEDKEEFDYDAFFDSLFEQISNGSKKTYNFLKRNSRKVIALLQN